MTIATLILTCLLLSRSAGPGHVFADRHRRRAIVCIAAANAGNTSQDLKTASSSAQRRSTSRSVGHRRHRVSVVIGLTLLYLHNNLGGIGSQNLAAPQATLMSTIIKGLLNQNLPWGLV
jgi:uncharacterized oligopeptide transporter (OPT) family protein